MTKMHLVFPLVAFVLAISCSHNSQRDGLANEFLDAFYSFDKSKLEALLANAGDSRQTLTFYQGWAEGGHYKVITRHPFVIKSDSVIICPVTVEDDLIKALQLDMHVTDSFHLTIAGNQIRSVTTSSNDPDLFREAMDWVNQNKGDEVEGPCRGESQSPGDCVRVFVNGFAEFITQRKN